MGMPMRSAERRCSGWLHVHAPSRRKMSTRGGRLRVKVRRCALSQLSILGDLGHGHGERKLAFIWAAQLHRGRVLVRADRPDELEPLGPS